MVQFALGLVVVFAIFEWIARFFGSDRGRAGLVVGAVVVAAIPGSRAGAVRPIAQVRPQAGIAEEVLFRGYLFRHLRQGRTFWEAAIVASGPFVLVHLSLIATMPWAIALTSVLLAALISFPLARLFELGGNTVWAPALVHWVVQGVVKVVIATQEAARVLPWCGLPRAQSFHSWYFWVGETFEVARPCRLARSRTLRLLSRRRVGDVHE
jgi:membrane protease YdiL (CAAX protease family)